MLSNKKEVEDPDQQWMLEGWLKYVAKELKAAVGSVEVVKRNLTSGDRHVGEVIKLKLWDKPKNLEMLFKHLGLLKERLEYSGGIEIKWQD